MTPSENTAALIHIGYHKTGTTWMQRRVFTQSSFGFSRIWPKKLIDDGFVTINPFSFDPKHAVSLVEDQLAAARDAGTVPVLSHERLSGFDLLGGYDAGVIAERLHAAFPNGRVLIVIREQAAMMTSMYKQHIKKSGTEKVDELWRKRSARELRRPVPRLEVYEYHHLIARYQELFGADHVLVLPYELLRTDAPAFVARICAFVGVPAPDEIPMTRENPAQPGALTGLLRWSNIALRAIGQVGSFGGPVRSLRLRTLRQRVADRVGKMLPKALSRRYDRKLQAAVEALCGDRFVDSNQITQELTQLDLASYGYRVAAGTPEGNG